MKYLSNHIPILKSLLNQLGLLSFNNHTEGGQRLNEAAQWALNDSTFSIGKYEVTALCPVLETLKRGNSAHFINPKRLSTDLGMPIMTPPNNLSNYFSDFKKALEDVKNKDEQLLTTLEVYASSVAINAKYNDLSLFDFIRSTVGIAACLEQGNGKLRLLSGSISGIQSYLYEIISKNAAKLLKGRSFYIQLLTDSLLEEVLDKFDLSLCHVVYSSGGGFYVLIPDTEGVQDEFDNFKEGISKQLYAKHKMSLFAELTITKPFGFPYLEPINQIWDCLFEDLGKLKYKRLQGNNDLLNDFFGFIEVGGTSTEKRDPITNDEMKDTDEKGELFGTKMLKITKQQIELGKDLRGANYWISSKQRIGNKTETIQDPFGKFHYLEQQIPRGDLRNASITAINNTDDYFPFTFYGGNNFPTDPKTGYAKGFDELIENENFKRLAILRMDVDGLGAIFSGDINTKTYSLNWVRYTSVSRSLDQFFKGYLNELQKPYRETSVIIYSGGDDLFVVGKWDDVLALSEEIHLKFKDWSCGNLTLSGGIVLLPNKFPVMQGAKLADDVEKKAKNHEIKPLTEGDAGLKKNAITLFDTPLRWDTEFKIVKDIFLVLNKLIDDKKLDKSFLGKIYIHSERQKAYDATQKELKDAKKENRKPSSYFNEFSPAWRWTMAYDMTRYRDNVRDEKAKNFIDEIKTACFTDRYEGNALHSKHSFLTLLQLATRWVELTYRSKKNNNLS